MGLELKTSASADQQSVIVYDKTGSIDDCDTGFGLPNLRVSDMADAYFIITPPGGTPTTINVSPDLPSDEGLGYEFLAEDFGLTKITAGIWGIEYVVVYDPVNGTKETFRSKCYFYFDDTITCCISNKVKTIDPFNTPKDEQITINRLSSLLERARDAAKQGDLSRADKIAKYLSNQCDCCI